MPRFEPAFLSSRAGVGAATRFGGGVRVGVGVGVGVRLRVRVGVGVRGYVPYLEVRPVLRHLGSHEGLLLDPLQRIRGKG